MSNRKDYANELIKKIESDIKEGLDEKVFINDFRKKIEEFVSEISK